MTLPKRETIRLPEYDYRSPGYYFITVCTREKAPLLCSIVGTGLPDGPQIKLTDVGTVVRSQLETMRDFYDTVKLNSYVIMPNHIHLLIEIRKQIGPSGRTVPTDSGIGWFAGTFKRFTNRTCGKDLWQPRSYDHVIRDEADYVRVLQYIENNPAKWTEDRYYITE